MPEWAVIALAVVIGLAGLFVLLAVVVPRSTRRIQSVMVEAGDDPAPGWHARCTKCGRTRRLADVGGVRIGAYKGSTKYTLGYCRGCEGLRIVRVIHASRMEPGRAESAT